MPSRQEKEEKLAREILLLSRNTLLVNLRFLDMALSQFELFPIGESTLLTDGRHILFHPRHVLESYKLAKETPVRDYLHMVLHCVFRHMYMDPTLDRPYWDLACDIAVENVINDLGLTATATPKAQKQNAYGYTVQKGKAGRRGNNHMEIIQELQRRYPEGSPYCKVGDLLKANADLKLKTLNNNAQSLFGMSLADYLQSIGLLQPQDFQKDLDDLVAQLRLRYPDPENLPRTVKEIKVQNADLPILLLAYASQHGISAKAYLRQAGVLQPDATPEKIAVQFEKEPIDENLIRSYVSILKQRYAGKPLPTGIRSLAGENPDLAVNRIHTHLRKNLKEPVEKFYIRNGIFKGLPTDLNTYTFCKVQLDVGQTVWAFGIEDIAGVQVGDRVRTDYDWTSKNGVLLEKITCLGLDAPCPVKDIHICCLGREILIEEIVRDVSAGQVIPDTFQTVDKAQFDYPDAVDLFQCNIRGIPVYDLAQIRFRGYREEMDKLCAFLKIRCLNTPCHEIEGGIWELQAKGWYLKVCYPEIIRNIPALKVTGLLEALDGGVYAFYSESGASAVTACRYCGEMDWKSDSSDSRWANYIDMTMPHQGCFIHVQTSEPVSVRYNYPYLSQWNDLDYVREKDGVLYSKP